MSEIRKSLRKNNDTEGKFDGDGGLYNMFSCDRINRWKTVVTCAIDCVAQKLAMVNSKMLVFAILINFLSQINSDEIILDVAKLVVKNNFAVQRWEKNVTDDLVEKCSKDVANINSKKIDGFGLQCSSKAAEFAYCIWRELFLICPQDEQQKNRQCDKLRSVLEKVDDNKFKN